MHHGYNLKCYKLVVAWLLSIVWEVIGAKISEKLFATLPLSGGWMSGSDTNFDSFGYIHLFIRIHTFTHSDTDIYSFGYIRLLILIHTFNSFGYRHLTHSDIDISLIWV